MKMKILGFLTAILFTFGLGMISAHADLLKGTSENGLTGSVYRGPDEGRSLWIQAEATSAGKTEKYQKKAEETINEYKGKLKELEVKAKTLSEKGKAEVREAMKELQKEIDAAEQKIKSLRSASGEAWDKLKADIDASLEKVKEGYKKIVASFG